MGAAAMGADMPESWKDWEGRSVDGKFRLESYLGGSDATAVFRTEAEGAPAAIRILVIGGGNTDPADGDKQLQRWEDARELRHPNLMTIFSAGKTRVAGREVVYLVEEFAEENLGEIIPERALSSDEVRGMLKPVLTGLELLHAHGFIHGGLRPSHIFAVGDQVKLSSDGLLKPGEVPLTGNALDAPELAASGASSATDAWALGMTLVEVMTRRVPAWDTARMSAPVVSEDVPEPFRAIARGCLEIYPVKRWGIAEIRERLEPRAPRGLAGPRELTSTQNAREASGAAVSEPVVKASPNWRMWGGLAVAGFLAFLLLRAHKTEPNWQKVVPPPSASTQGAPTESAPMTSSPQASSSQSTAQQALPPQSSPQQASRPSPLGAKDPESSGETQAPASNGDIVGRATPDVSASARRTIQGRIKVRVRVNVDAAGNVTSATLKEAGPSQYFARSAEEAAKRWKFAPAQGDGQDERSWTLLFVFTRGGTEMSAAKAK